MVLNYFSLDTELYTILVVYIVLLHRKIVYLYGENVCIFDPRIANDVVHCLKKRNQKALYICRYWQQRVTWTSLNPMINMA